MAEATEVGRAQLRIARPTDDLAAVVAFYRDGLGLEVLSAFAGHDGFDGVMLGRAGASYHLEFTRKAGHAAGRAPTADNLLVFYLPDEAQWRGMVAQMERAGHHPVPAFNPYWDRVGRTFEDPDGYRVVLQWGSWPAGPATAPNPDAEPAVAASASGLGSRRSETEVT